MLDGVLLPGATSNIAPWRYGGAPARPGTLQDEARDAAAVALAGLCIGRGLPLLAICRGFQELNVAMGGTLHPHVHEVPGRLDHREDPHADHDAQYAPAHPVLLTGFLERIAPAPRMMVNSLHHQGVDRLAARLRADAVAPDGQIEAASMPGAEGFVLGVQWHPEWRWSENPLSRAIFAVFGRALRGEGSTFTPS
jgi:putative glutamine amidotransferase